MGKFGKFGGELSIIHQTKTIQISTKINDILADLLIHKTFFRQMLEESQFKTLPPPNFPAIWCQVFKPGAHRLQAGMHLVS